MHPILFRKAANKINEAKIVQCRMYPWLLMALKHPRLFECVDDAREVKPIGIVFLNYEKETCWAHAHSPLFRSEQVH